MHEHFNWLIESSIWMADVLKDPVKASQKNAEHLYHIHKNFINRDFSFNPNLMEYFDFNVKFVPE